MATSFEWVTGGYEMDIVVFSEEENKAKTIESLEMGKSHGEEEEY